MRADSGGHFHVSRWPPGWRKDRRRVPAILEGGPEGWYVVDPDGLTWPVASHRDVVSVANDPYGETKERRRLDIYVDRLPHYPWLDDAMLTEGTSAYPRGRHRIGGLVCPTGNAKIRIEEASAWGMTCANAEFLAVLVQVYALCGVGAQPTPGALGISTMEVTYRDQRHPRQNRPSHALRAALLAGRIGGRSDPAISDQVYAQVYELDLHDAYLSAASKPLPVGSITRFLEDEVTCGPGASGYLYPAGRDDGPLGVHRTQGLVSGELSQSGGVWPANSTGPAFATWYGRAVVFLTDPQSNFPICTRSASGRVAPLSERGWYNVWGWREEFEAAARRSGVSIVVREGWGWLETAPVLSEWANGMHERRHAARLISPAAERCIKLAIVAGIGRHGCRPERKRIVHLSQSLEGDVVLSDDLEGAWCSRVEKEHDAPWLTFWHDYIVMQIRLWQYEQIERERAAGNVVITTNVDAVYTLWPTKSPVEPDRLGGIRQRLRTNIRFPYARGAVWDGGVKLPGLALESEERRAYARR